MKISVYRRSFLFLCFIAFYGSQLVFSQNIPLKVRNFVGEWTQYSLGPEIISTFKGLDINQAIQKLREPENNVTVLVFPFKPDFVAANPDLKIENPVECAELEKFYHDKFERYVAEAGDSIAITRPPYSAYFLTPNLGPEFYFARPGLSDFQIHLGSATDMMTVLHEWTHVLLQRQYFSDKVTLEDGSQVHFINRIRKDFEQARADFQNQINTYEAISSSVDSLPEQIREAENNFTHFLLRVFEMSLFSRVTDIEEIVVHYQMLIHAEEMGFLEKEQSTAAWFTMKYALDLEIFLNDVLLKNPQWSQLNESFDKKILNEKLSKDFEQVRDAFLSLKNEISKHLDRLRPILVKKKLNMHMAEFVRNRNRGK